MFNDRFLDSLEWFSLVHILTLVIILGALTAFCLWGARYLDKTPLRGRIFRYLLATFMLLFEIVYHTWRISSYERNPMFWPLYLCTVVCFMTIIALYTNNSKIINVVFPMAVVGVFFAVLFPSTGATVPHFNFFHYFIVHTAFLTGSLYFVVNRKLKFTLRGLILSIASLFVYGSALLVVALTTGYDYWLFLLTSPLESISDGLGIWYTPVWIVFIFSLIAGVHYLTKFIIKKLDQKKLNSEP